MVNKTFLPSVVIPSKHLTPSKTVVFQTGTAFAEMLADHGLGRACAVREISGPAWESSARIDEGENHRWRIRFSSDYQSRWCWNGRWMSSPTTSPTSTPTAS